MVLRFNLALSLAFLFFGCADIERDSPYDPKSRDYGGSMGGNVYCSMFGYCELVQSADVCIYSYGGIVVHDISSCYSLPSSSSVVPSSSSLFVGVPCDNASTGSATVTCGGQTYKTVQIGSQTWMAENLNYNASGSVCYGNESSNCTTYGRLYNWATAMGLDPSCNSSTCASRVQSKHRGICPSGWHIPSNEDWDQLFRYADGTSGTSSPYDSPTAGKHLKAKTGWSSCGPSGSGSPYSCEDTHGFSALPGGIGNSDGGFYGVGNYGIWWSASEYSSSYAYFRGMNYDIEYAYWNYNDKTYSFSVRCVQDW